MRIFRFEGPGFFGRCEVASPLRASSFRAGRPRALVPCEKCLYQMDCRRAPPDPGLLWWAAVGAKMQRQTWFASVWRERLPPCGPRPSSVPPPNLWCLSTPFASLRAKCAPLRPFLPKWQVRGTRQVLAQNRGAHVLGRRCRHARARMPRQ